MWNIPGGSAGFPPQHGLLNISDVISLPPSIRPINTTPFRRLSFWRVVSEMWLFFVKTTCKFIFNQLPSNSSSLDFLSATWAPITSLESHPVSACGTRPSFGSNIPYRYQRLSAARADQVSSELDKLINVSQFIIRALSSPCQPANGNINHRLPHHDPSHIAAAHPLPTALSSVDSPKYRQRPEHIRLKQMSDAVRKQPQTWLTYRVCHGDAFHAVRSGVPALTGGLCGQRKTMNVQDKTLLKENY